MTELTWHEIDYDNISNDIHDCIKSCELLEGDYFRISCDSGVFIYDSFEERLLDITGEIDEAVLFHNDQFCEQYMRLKQNGTPEEIIDLIERFGYKECNVLGED